MIWEALGKYCGWHEVLSRAAAVGGNWGNLKYARATSCPWDGTTRSEAAGSGNVNILR